VGGIPIGKALQKRAKARTEGCIISRPRIRK